MRNLIVGLLLVAVLAAGGWFLFGRDGKLATALPGATGDADAPLAYVPADTPYLIANLDSLPKDKLEVWLQQSDAMTQMWRTQFDMALAKLASEEPENPGTRWLKALDAEFRGKTVMQSIEMLGIDLQGRSAIYGIGLVPVARMALGDPEAFRSFVARVETAAGEKIPTARVDDIDYWQFTDADAPLRGILALQGRHLVMTLAPANDDGALRTLLGVDKPAASLRDGGELPELNARYGYTPYATGYVDTARVVALLTAAPTPLETAFLGALDVTKPDVDAVCQAEYAALAQAVPRLVFGYTELEPKRSVGVSHLELREDIAKDLMTLRAPMPGLAAAEGSLFNFGLSLKLAQLPALASKWAGAVQSAPWQCASLQELNTAFAEGSTQLNNPAVFAAAPVFEGVHAIATRFAMPQPGQEPDFAGKLLIGSPNPAALIGMAQSFAPQLASLQLKPDGEVKAVRPMPGMPTTMPAHVAMTDKLLGIAVGAGEEATLVQAMGINPAQQPLLVVGYSGAAFAQFFEQMQSTMEAAEEDEAKREEMRRSVEMMRKMYAMIRRIEMRVEFDETGVVIHQSADMN